MPLPEKPTSFDLSVFQLSAPFGAWSLLRKWSCPADSEVSAEVSGALNFILCASIILHYAVRHNFTSALADTSLKAVRVRSHTQNSKNIFFVAHRHARNLFCLPWQERFFTMISVPFGHGWYTLRVWYLLRRWYTLRVWRNGYYIMLAQQVYHTACRISYRVSGISLKSAAKRDIICSINKNLTTNISWIIVTYR